mmetsp:Transcript_13250/g.27822  ORF Transcript_13250/g.27822 Transcript_13250/m.27822 type:complete len:133 (-) Transcript_13250:742-1140(-)
MILFYITPQAIKMLVWLNPSYGKTFLGLMAVMSYTFPTSTVKKPCNNKMFILHITSLQTTRNRVLTCTNLGVYLHPKSSQTFSLALFKLQSFNSRYALASEWLNGSGCNFPSLPFISLFWAFRCFAIEDTLH